MGEGAGRTLRQVAHVTQDKVSHIISEVGRRNREFVPILFVKTTDFQLVFIILSMVLWLISGSSECMRIS